jgi:hypothetical protein
VGVAKISTRAKILAAIVFLSLAALGHHSWGTVDAIQRLALTRSLLLHGRVVTESYGPIKYGPAQSVLMLPSYAVGYGGARLLGLGDPDRAGYRATAFLFSPILSALLIVQFAKIGSLRFPGSKSGALPLWSLLWATLLLPYTRILFSEPLNAFLLLFTVAELTAAEFSGRTPRGRVFLALGALCLNYIIFTPLLLGSCLLLPFREWRARGRRSAVLLAARGGAAVAVCTGVWLWYNHARFGSPLQFGYAEEGFKTPFLTGSFGLLASPGRGLIFYSPLSAVGLIGMVSLALRKSQIRWIDAGILAICLFYFALYSTWGAFEGGWCWGPRFLLPFLPLLHLGAVDWLNGGAWKRRIFLLGLAVGSGMNAWSYATNWQEYERQTFGPGGNDYLLSVFDWRYASALHGFAGTGTVRLLLQFAAVGVLSWLAIRCWCGTAEDPAARGDTVQ